MLNRPARWLHCNPVRVRPVNCARLLFDSSQVLADFGSDCSLLMGRSCNQLVHAGYASNLPGNGPNDFGSA